LTSSGRQAETAAALYLVKRGYILVERNWKIRWCEIDLVVCHQSCLYLVEVKYRNKITQGYGADYITAKKLRQMQRAAEWYVWEKGWHKNYQLAFIEVTGPNFAITKFISNIT
jgi:putative endonuclease